MITDKAAIKGVNDGVYEWLMSYPRGSGLLFVEGIEKAVTKWLDVNKEDVLKSISDGQARESRPGTQ